MAVNTTPPSPAPKTADGTERASSRPGVMLYFDLAPMLVRLSDEQRGKLLMAIVDYAQSGNRPEPDDIVLHVLWPFIEQRIDTDAQVYQEKVTKSRYAAYCRDARRAGEEPVSYDCWLTTHANEDTEDRALSPDIDRCASGIKPDQPSSNDSKRTPNTDTKSKTASNTESESTAASAAKINNKGVNKRPSRFTPPTVDEIRLYCLERKNTVDARRFFDHYAAVGWYVGKSRMQDWRAAVRKWERSEDNDKSAPGTGDNSAPDTGRWSEYNLRYDT